jgi:nicotinamidase-related amidase
MLQIYLDSLRCEEDTNEADDDEPYVLVTSVNLASNLRIPGVPIGLPIPAFDVFLLRYRAVSEGETRPGNAYTSFWNVTGRPASLTNPEEAIFVVALVENDDGDPDALRGIVKGIVGASILGSISLNRDDKVAALLRDVDSALKTPTGFPNLDEKIGQPQELRLSAEELGLVEAGFPVQKPLVFNGDGAQYTLTFTARKANPWSIWHRIHPELVFNQAVEGPVASVARYPDHLDLFKIGPDGTMWSCWWHDDEEGWRPWYPTHPDIRFPPHARVTVLSRNPDHLDLLAIGVDGVVWWSWWHDDEEGWRPWSPVHPELTFPDTSQITVVARQPDHLDLFIIAPDGRVWSCWWHDDGKGWRPWYPTHPEAHFSAGAAVTALARTPGHLDLFAIGIDGIVKWSWWQNDQKGWRPWEPVFREAKFDAALRSFNRIVAIARFPNHIDLFVTGDDGAVWSCWWHDDEEGWRPAFPIRPETRFPSHARITALARKPEQLDVFTVAADGTLWWTWYRDDNLNWRPWEPVNQYDKLRENTQVTAIARDPGHISLFGTRVDGIIITCEWHDDNP